MKLTLVVNALFAVLYGPTGESLAVWQTHERVTLVDGPVESLINDDATIRTRQGFIPVESEPDPLKLATLLAYDLYGSGFTLKVKTVETGFRTRSKRWNTPQLAELNRARASLGMLDKRARQKGSESFSTSERYLLAVQRLADAERAYRESQDTALLSTQAEPEPVPTHWTIKQWDGALPERDPDELPEVNRTFWQDWQKLSPSVGNPFRRASL